MEKNWGDTPSATLIMACKLGPKSFDPAFHIIYNVAPQPHLTST